MISSPRVSIILLILCLTVPGFASVAADDAASLDAAVVKKNHQANADCFACHSAAGLKNPPRADLDLGKLEAALMVEEVFNESNHGHMDCRECHGQSYREYPHAAAGKSETSPCSECHAAKVLRLEPQFAASVHGRHLKDKMTCSTCHDPHIALSAAKLNDPRKIVAQDNVACLACHNSDTTFAKFAPESETTPGVLRTRPDIDSIHAWLPNTRLHWQAVRCVECHTPAVAASKLLSHEILNKEKAEKHCVTCHSRDSSLNTRLYRHLVKDEQQQHGFTNSIILANAYVIGATRHPVLDATILGLAALTLLGVLGHGVLRLLFAIRRKRPSR